MRFISTRVHGLLDYLMGLLLCAAPWILGFGSDGAETAVPVSLGIGLILYSLVTRYELGIVPLLPMPSHLFLDGLSGAFLAASPWLLGFANDIWWPHVLFGALEVAAAMMTQTVPESIGAPPAGADRRDRAMPPSPRVKAVAAFRDNA